MFIKTNEIILKIWSQIMIWSQKLIINDIMKLNLESVRKS